MRSHDTTNLISSDPKQIGICVCANFHDFLTNIKRFMYRNGLPLPPSTAILQAKNPDTLALSNAHSAGSSCELRILS